MWITIFSAGETVVNKNRDIPFPCKCYILVGGNPDTEKTVNIR